MTTLLKKYELYIGVLPELAKKEKVSDTSKSDTKIPSANIKSIPAKGDFILLTDHHIEADVKFIKEGKGDKNPTQTIKIYNPAPDTERFTTQGNVILLKAGYNEDQFLPIVCAAQIVSVETSKSGTDRVMTILCSEAHNARRKLEYSKSFVDTQTKYSVLTDMLNTFKYYGVPTGRVQVPDSFKTETLGTSQAFMGHLEKELEAFCSGNKLRWYIAGGEIFVEPIGKEFKDYINVVVVKSGEIKNTIETLDDSSNKTKKELESKTKGVKFTVNLLPDTNLADGVRVVASDGDPESFKKHEGVYLISSVEHSLSYEGDSWDTTIEAKG